MATQPTANAVPSESPRDLKFNAGKIDEFVTSLQREYEDRFGNKHYTIEGIRWVAQQAIAKFGYITIDSFELGNVLTLPNQVLRYESTGEYYRWDGTFPKTVAAGSTPDTTGGIGVGKWMGVGSAAFSERISTLPTYDGVYDVFVVYGQSNAIGFAGADNGFSSADFVTLSDKAYYWDGAKIAPLTHYMKHSSGDVSTGSAWDQFALRYTSLTGRGVVFIPCAKAGVSITELSKGGSNYTNAKGYIDSFNAFDSDLELGERYIVFHQGEQDQLSAMDRDTYQTNLSALISNMLSDFDSSNFYIIKVGCPITRSERLWNSVQNAQELLATTLNDCRMATRICTSFNRSNLLLGSDTTHYSIKGYNLMGDDAACNIAHDVMNKTRVSNYGSESYSALMLPGQLAWNSLSAYVTMESSGGGSSFVINTSNNTNGNHRVSNFTDIIYNSTLKTFLLKSSARISSVLNLLVKGNDVAEANGFHVTAKRYDSRNIQLDFFVDIDFFINMSNGQLLGVDAGLAPEWVAGNVAISLDSSTKTATITHGESAHFPACSPASNPQLSNTQGSIVSRRISSTQFKVKMLSGDYNVVQVSMRKVKANAGTLLLNGFGFYISAITSEG